MKTETYQFRMRLPKEIHAILKRLSCDENKTMTALFIEMFEAWLENYHLDPKMKDNFTNKAINDYWKKKKSCK